MTDQGPISRPRDPGDAGYTLLEVLIALALLAAIAVLASNTLRYARQTYSRIQSELETISPQVVQHYLFRLIEHAQPIHLPGRRREDATFVSGEAARLVLLSNYTLAAQYAGLYETELKFEPAVDDIGDVVLRQRPYRPRKPEDQDGRDGATETVVLVRGVRSMRIQYFGANSSRELETWNDTWTNSQSLPKLIRIDVTFAKGDSRIWPPLMSRPKLAE